MHPHETAAPAAAPATSQPPHKRRVRAILPPLLWDRLEAYALHGGFTSPHHAAVELIRRGLYGEAPTP